MGETHPSMTSLSALFCLRYEEEVSLRATAENEFVALKKVSNMGLGSTDMRVSDGQSSWGDLSRRSQPHCGVHGLTRSGWGIPRD